MGWSNLGRPGKEAVQAETLLEARVEFGMGGERQHHGAEEGKPRGACQTELDTLRELELGREGTCIAEGFELV